MTFYFEDETDNILKIDYKNIITSVIEESLNFVKCPYETEINVVLTNNEGIQQINQEYRQIDSPTDVLSFPLIEYSFAADFSKLESLSQDCFNPDTGELMLGDIVISAEKVLEQADKYGHSIKRELAFLTAHSMLHLFGYDHIEKEQSFAMEEKQEQILTNLEIAR